MPATLQYRHTKITSPLGEDALLFHAVRGEEEMSRLYEYQLEVLSENPVKPKDLLGQPMTASIGMRDGKQRHFSGYVAEWQDDGDWGGMHKYTLSLVPWLWGLTRRSNCRIFQQKTALDIIKQIFSEHSLQHFKDLTHKTPRTRDYCVQYRETDFNFVSRLMEEEGIFYFFDQSTPGIQNLTLADDNSALKPIANTPTLKYFQPENMERREVDHLYGMGASNRIQSKKYSLKDFDFEAVTKKMEVNVSSPHEFPLAAEQYDYPGSYIQPSDGTNYASVRLEALEAEYERYRGEGNAFNLATGGTFTLDAHYNPEFNQEYLVTGIKFWVQANQYSSSGGEAPEFSEYMGISAIKAATRFRTGQRTPKPVVRGPQTAIVVGPSGEEIYTDKYGRVKVAFHWDRETKFDESSSCWIRVSQLWAGKKWGGIHIPRMGQEVVVAFLEGDPDQPLIVGRVYNADQTVPYALPANMTRSGIQSRSTKGGGDDNFNEIYMEDKLGSELLSINAEKDMKTVVENSSTVSIGFEKKSPGDSETKIYNNRTTTIEMGNDTFQVKKGNQEDKVDMGNRTTTLGMGNDELTIKMGNQTTKLNLGASSTEALQSIELKVGQSSIKVDQMGVTIKGMMIKIEGTVQTSVKGLMTQVNGDAMLTVKGGITMIN